MSRVSQASPLKSIRLSQQGMRILYNSCGLQRGAATGGCEAAGLGRPRGRTVRRRNFPSIPRRRRASGGDYAAPREELGADWALLAGWGTARLNPSRSGPAVNESTWQTRYEPTMRRLLGYAKAMGRQAPAVTDLLADGPLLLDYALFLADWRRARWRSHPPSQRRKRRQKLPAFAGGARALTRPHRRRACAKSTAEVAMRVVMALSELLYSACGIRESDSSSASTWRALLASLPRHTPPSPSLAVRSRCRVRWVGTDVRTSPRMLFPVSVYLSTSGYKDQSSGTFLPQKTASVRALSARSPRTDTGLGPRG